MKIEHIKQKDRYIEVVWAEGEADRFHYVWLRDHLPDATFFDPQTGERLIDAHTYLSDAQPESVSIDESGNLMIAWSNQDTPSHYSADWLHANSYSDTNLRTRDEALPQQKNWRFQSFHDVKRHNYERIFYEPSAAYDFLCDFRAFGFAYTDNAPKEPGVVEALTSWLGYLREVCFGPVREIRSEPSYDNVAFTSRVVPPHIDGTNYLYPYEVQFMHCIENDATGGDSTIVDGFAVANNFRETNPEGFGVLSRINVPFKIGAGDHDVRHSAPIIELNREGGLRIIRFSNQQRRILSVPFDDVETFYRAYAQFSEMINAEEHQLAFRFQPGEVLMFNNHRVLHSRAAFQPSSGRRYLSLATADMDMVDSRLRRLTRQLRTNENLDIMFPQEPVM